MFLSTKEKESKTKGIALEKSIWRSLIKVGDLVHFEIRTHEIMGIVYDIIDDSTVARNGIVTFIAVMWSDGMCAKYNKIYFKDRFKIISEI